MNGHEIAKEYAKALVELGEEKGVVSQLEEEFQAFSSLLDQVESFRIFLETPNIGREEKKKVLEKALKGRLSGLFLHFLFLVVERGRFLLFPYIQEEFRNLVDEKQGRVRALVWSAREVDGPARLMIEQALRERTQKEVTVEYKVKPQLLGGLVLKVGDTQIDGSLRTKLENWKKGLLEKKYQF